MVGEFFDGKYFGLLSFNFALMLFSALGGIRAMMRGFSKADLTLKRRNIFRQYGVALMIFLVLLQVASGAQMRGLLLAQAGSSCLWGWLHHICSRLLALLVGWHLFRRRDWIRLRWQALVELEVPASP